MSNVQQPQFSSSRQRRTQLVPVELDGARSAVLPCAGPGRLVHPGARGTMATAEQLKALLKSYSEGDEERFFATAMQVAAHAARQGHGKLAQELRELIDAAKA